MKKSPGRPPLHGETKIRVALLITRGANDALQAEVAATGISRNEIIEAMLRSRYNINNCDARGTE